MKVWILNELFRLTRTELFALHHEIVTELANTPDGSPERDIALSNLRLIARALARPNLAPD